MVYRPAALSQIDGSRFAQSNCVPTTTALLIDRATVGAIRTTGAEVRRRSGDTSGGLTMLQATSVAMTFGVSLAAKFGIGRNALRDLAVSGRGLGICISCRVTINTTRRTNWYVGPHMVYANQWRLHPAGEVCTCEKRSAARHGEFLIDDPGTTAAGFLWWSEDLVFRAAEAYGGGGIFTLASPDTEGVKRKAVKGGWFYRNARVVTAERTRSITPAREYAITNTTNGVGWRRANGTTAHGYWRTSAGDHAKGDRLA